LQTIFEEQFFARTLEDAVAIAGRSDVRVCSEADQIFHFGPFLAYGGGAAAQSLPGSPKASAAAQDGYDAGDDVVERLRFTNIKAIPCKVQLRIGRRDDDKKCGNSTGDMPFAVSPSEFGFLPHEAKQIDVTFCPKSLAGFGARLETTVVGGTDPKTNNLSFEIRGEGAVPSVSLQGPRLFGDEGGELKLGKLPLGKSHEVAMALRNDSLLSAKVRVDHNATSAFSVSCPAMVHLNRGESRSLKASFHLRALGEWNSDSTIRSVEMACFEPELANNHSDSECIMIHSGFASASDQKCTEMAPKMAFLNPSWAIILLILNVS
jgi:hypothetical protein